MEFHQQIWRNWVVKLDQWGLKSFCAWLLEATAPVHIVGAQLVHVGTPVLGFFFPKQDMLALATLLETPEEVKAFSTLLAIDLRREAPSSES